MTEITRRNILRGMAVAPVGGRIAIEQIKTRMMVGGLLGAGIATDACVEVAGGESKFTSFAAWLAGGGEHETRRSANDIDGFDADIIAMQSFSLVAKVRMQRKRNYDRILASKRIWFKNILARKGIVRDWF